MKLFGFYITTNNWRHKFECANAIANRNAQETTQYKQSWEEARKELSKTIAQMEAARNTHKRETENALAEIAALNKIIKTKNDKIAKLETAKVFAEGRRNEIEEENCKLKEKLYEAEEAVDFEKDVNAETNKNREAERKAYEEKIAALQDYIEELEKANEGLKHELTKTTGKIPNRDQVLIELQKRVAELETACDKLIDENTEYSSTIEHLRLQISTQKELLVELQMELDTYKERHQHKVELQRARQKKYKANKKAKNIEQVKE